MKFFNSQKYSELEEKLYEQVVTEMIQGVVDKGLWAKAYSDASGDEKLAKSLYIKYKVEKLIDKIKQEETQKRKVVSQETLDRIQKNDKLFYKWIIILSLFFVISYVVIYSFESIG